MLYPQKGSIAIGSRRTTPTLPVAAAVVSEPSVAPRKTPCDQLNDWSTSGTVVARRPPKMIAEMGTPPGSSANLEREGLLLIGAVKRELGCAAFSGDAGVQRSPFQSMSSGGGGSLPSHHTSPLSGVRATLVKMVSLPIVAMALWFDCSLVPGATPKYPF